VNATNFVFFIDGLDEFKGEETELATFILEMTSSPNVKMCVASRPWLVFEDAFEHRPSLLLENLTAPDISFFVAGSLSSNGMFSKMQRLYPHDAERVITEVTSKAHGVFLWVRLVVDSLLGGLRDGDSIEDLMKSLLELPSDLEDLFWKILRSVSVPYRKQASYLFQLIQAASTPPSLLTLLFTEKDFQSVMEAEVKEISIDERSFRAETIRRRLNSRCRGLLEAPEFDLQGSEAKVQYLHRTVKDFLNRQEVQKYVISSSQEVYNPYSKFCSAFLLRVKTHQRRNNQLNNFWSNFNSCIEYSLRLDLKDHIAVIEELEKSANELFGTCDAKGESWLQTVLSEERQYGLFVMQRIVHWTATATYGNRSCKCFMDYARNYGLTAYVDYREDKERREAMESKNSLQHSAKVKKWKYKDKKETSNSHFGQLGHSFRKAFRGLG